MSEDIRDCIQPLDWLSVEGLGHKHSQPVVGAIPTPFPAWNRACRGEGGGIGLAPGWHITIGGGSGQGKSLVALNLAARASLEGALSAFLSYEMSRDQIITRFLSTVSGALVNNLEPGQSFRRDTWQEAAEWWWQNRKAGFLLAERPPRSIAGMQTLLRACAEDHGAKLIVVDYIQLVGVGEIDTVFDRVLRVSAAIQEVAFQYNVTTIGLSQFNRMQSFNKRDTPANEGLAGGGAIENDSDQVLLLDHSSYERTTPTSAKTNLLLSKNRHGPMTSIPVEWDYRVLQVRERDSLVEAQQRIRRVAS